MEHEKGKLNILEGRSNGEGVSIGKDIRNIL